MFTWDTSQYLKFHDERTRPARELLARVPTDRAECVVDLGSGPGNSTALLLERFPGARVTGVDNSKEMIDRARQDRPDVEWVLADLRSYRSDVPVDLIFSNAVLHWLPDHQALFPDLLGRVRPGGVLAVQMPSNFDEPSHRLIFDTEGPWRERLASLHGHAATKAPPFYFDALAKEAVSVDIWTTRYEHVMSDAHAIVDWVKGTGLRPYLAALPESERDPFLAAYERNLDAAYPRRADGRRLFSFHRLFVVAVRR